VRVARVTVVPLVARQPHAVVRVPPGTEVSGPVPLVVERAPQLAGRHLHHPPEPGARPRHRLQRRPGRPHHGLREPGAHGRQRTDRPRRGPGGSTGGGTTMTVPWTPARRRRRGSTSWSPSCRRGSRGA